MLLVTFSSKQSNLLLLPIYITCRCDLNAFVSFVAIMLYFANVIICKDIILHIKWLSNFHDNSHGELMLQIMDFETFHTFY